jgi:hypothetical protein
VGIPANTPEVVTPASLAIATRWRESSMGSRVVEARESTRRNNSKPSDRPRKEVKFEGRQVVAWDVQAT